jgi:hypothetical protein
MQKYRGFEDGDKTYRGGAWVEKNKDANEIYNFLPLEFIDDSGEYIAYFTGSYETKSSKKGTQNQTHIEKISGCQLLKKDVEAEGVLVIWCALSPKNHYEVVGWYNNATVFRHYQSADIEGNSEYNKFKREFNVFAKAKECVLLPIDERAKDKWEAPRARNKKFSFGFGQANIWYPVAEIAQDFVNGMVKQIQNYSGENLADYETVVDKN